MEFSRKWEGPLAPEVKKCVVLEKAAVLMSRGLYLETLENIESLGHCSDLTAYWLLRKSILEGICTQATGAFERTRKSLDQQKLLTDQIALPHLNLMRERRDLGFVIECENYLEASAQLRMIETEMLRNADPVIRTLFYQEGIRLALAVNDRAVMAEFWQLTQPLQNELSGSFVSMTEEICEAALMFQSADTAAVRISEQIAVSQRRGQFNSLCVAQFGLARALAVQEKFQEALASAEIALFVAEKHAYGRDRVRILFLLAGLSLKLGRDTSAHLHICI